MENKKASLNSWFDPFYVSGKMHLYVRALLSRASETHPLMEEWSCPNAEGRSTSLRGACNLLLLAAEKRTLKDWH